MFKSVLGQNVSISRHTMHAIMGAVYPLAFIALFFGLVMSTAPHM